MDTYIAIYAILLAVLAVGNATFCFFCVRAHALVNDSLRQEKARTKALEIELRNSRLEHGDLMRAHNKWVNEHKEAKGAEH